MSLNNLSNTHLTAAQLAAVQTALADLEAALQTVDVNLTPEDRQKYGSINERNKLLVNKVHDFSLSQPELRCTEVDWDEFAADYSSRQTCEDLIARLDSLILRLGSAKILHDYDNYQAALSDYAYTSYKAGSATPGFENKYNELKQFFAKAPKTPKTPTTQGNE